MSRTNYEAVSDYVGDWLHHAQCLAFDRFFRSNQVSNRASHIVAALLPKIPWCGPGAGLVRLRVVRQTHYPRQPADVKASKVGILPPPVLPQKRTYLRKLVPKRGWCV